MECVICFERYDLNKREPTSLGCGHTFCKACSSKITACPIDRSESKKSKRVKNFMMIALLDQKASGDKVGALPQSKCPKHKKVMEVYCVDHGEVICTICLLEKHKADRVEPLDHYLGMLEQQKSTINRVQEYLKVHGSPQKEKKSLMSMIKEEEKRVADHIKDRCQDVIDTINDRLSNALKIIGTRFKDSKRLIQRLLESRSESVHDQLLDMTNEALKSMGSLDELAMEGINKDVIDRIVENHPFIKEIEEAHKRSLLKPFVDLPSVAKAISRNVLEAFDAHFSFIDGYLGEIIFNPDLSHLLACNSRYENSKEVMVSDPSFTLTPETLSGLVSFCCPLDKIQIAALPSSSQANEFAVSFESKEEARSLLFLRGLSINNHPLDFKLFDKNAKAFLSQLKLYLLGELTPEIKSIDQRLASLISEFEGRLSKDVLQGYKQASVEINDSGLLTAMHLRHLLESMAEKLKGFSR